jgi:putative ATP-dependent endonuclease of OLD family
VLVGPNGVGKSSLLRAIDLVLDPFRDAYRERLRVHDFYGMDTTKPVVIEVVLDDLSADDRAHFEPYLEGRRSNGTYGGFDSPHEEFDESALVLRVRLRAEFEHAARSTYVRPEAEDKALSQEDKLRIGWHYVDAAVDPIRELAFYQDSVLSRLFEQSDISGPLDAIRRAIEGAKAPLLDEKTIKATRAKLERTAQRLGIAAGAAPLDFAVLGMSDRRVLQSLQLVLRGGRSTQHLPLLAHGRGVMRVLMLVATVQYAQLRHENLILAVEEPEQNLEPTNQRLATRNVLMDGSGARQVFLTTHSPDVAAAVELAQLHLVRDFDGGADVRALRMVAPEHHKFFERHAHGPLVDGLYANAVLLVEGTPEGGALPELLRRGDPGTSLDERRVEVVVTDGLAHMVSYVRFFGALGIPVLALCDEDDDWTDFERVRAAHPTLTVRWHTHRDWEGVLAAEADPTALAAGCDACLDALGEGAARFLPNLRDAVRTNAGEASHLPAAATVASMLAPYPADAQRRALAALLRGRGGFDFKSGLYGRLIAESLPEMPLSVHALSTQLQSILDGARPGDVLDL